MENIKVAFLPNNELQGYSALLKSVTDLTLYDTELVNLHILYNSDLDIDIGKSESSLTPYIKFTDINNLISTISGLVLSEDETVIIIYGYDLTLDDIRNNIFELVNDNEGVFISINLLCDDEDLKSNMYFYLDSSDYTDEEWKQEKNEISRIYEENKGEENDATTISFIYDPGSVPLDSLYHIHLIDKINSICDVSVEEKKEDKLKFDKHLEADDNYSKYSYEDYYNNISVGTINNAFFIEDEECNKVLFDKKGLGFIVEILSKLSK